MAERPYEDRIMRGADHDPNEADELFSPKYGQTTHGFSIGDILRRTNITDHTEAQADTEANLGHGRKIVIDVVDANNFTAIRAGNHHAITITSHGLGSFGTTLWLSQATAGLITATEPITGLRLYLGIILDANTIEWEPWADWQEV